MVELLKRLLTTVVTTANRATAANVDDSQASARSVARAVRGPGKQKSTSIINRHDIRDAKSRRLILAIENGTEAAHLGNSTTKSGYNIHVFIRHWVVALDSTSATSCNVCATASGACGSISAADAITKGVNPYATYKNHQLVSSMSNS